MLKIEEFYTSPDLRVFEIEAKKVVCTSINASINPLEDDEDCIIF